MKREVYILEAYSIHKAAPMKRSQHVGYGWLLKGVRESFDRGADFITIRRVQPP